jgi:hypothetical protein
MNRIYTLLLFTTATAFADTYVFVDDTNIAAKSGVVRKLHSAKRRDKPVIAADRPWEGGRVYTYGTPHFDEKAGEFRLWYNARLGRGNDHRVPELKIPNGDLVLYATSRDGVDWVKPNLGLFSFDGSRDNNIVHNLHSPSVVVDPNEPDSAKRYKMAGVGWDPRGYWGAYSADGLRWRNVPGNPILESSDTITATRDPATGEYFAFHKRGAEVRGHRRRTVWFATSRSFEKWSEPRLILAPDEEDDRWVTNPTQRTEFYVMSGFPYGGGFLGLLSVFRLTKTNDSKSPEVSPHDGPIEIQLAHSPDGRTWKRFEDRAPVIPLGKPGSFDGGAILGVSNPPLIYKDEMFVYYTAITTGHGGAAPEKKISIGRAAWRLDGFVSLEAERVGVVETKPFESRGALTVNADASRGSLQVEVLGATGKVLAQAERIFADSVRHQIRWRGGRALPEGLIRLRFHLKNASIYSFRTE